MKNNTTIFLSSTFRDMHAERDIIHNIVLPELSGVFAETACHLDFVDLRWGIDTEEEQDEQRATEKILEVCFGEIERSQPFFISFLGERYGWIPKVDNIESACLNAGLSPEQFRGKSITEMEIEFALSIFEQFDNCYFFFREGIAEEDILDPVLRHQYFSESDEEREKIQLLKKRLRETFPSRIFPYEGKWDNSANKIVGLETLGNDIVAFISEALHKEQDSWNESLADDYDKEQRIQEYFFDRTAENTINRARYTNELIRFAKGELTGKEAALIAPSGLGKSSMMAYVAKELEKEDILVLKISAGLTSNSLDFCFAIRYLYTRLAAHAQQKPIEGDYTQTKQAFYSLLTMVSQTRPVVIIMDALNQFDAGEQVQKLDWINELFLPERVKVLYSTLPDLFDDVLTKRDVHCLSLGELDRTEITSIAEVTARRFHKQLSKDVLEALCNKVDAKGEVCCRIPLYLSMFIEYVSDFDMEDYLAISEMEKIMGGAKAINEYLLQRVQQAPEDVATLFDAVASKCAKHIGEDKNEFITTMLGQSRFGVREQEICGVAKRFGLSVTTADFSLYRKMFRMHLVQRSDGRWDFGHQALRKSVRESGQKNQHQEIIQRLTAEYFLGLPMEDPIRKSELIYYLFACKQYQEIKCLFRDNQVSDIEVRDLMEFLSQKDGNGRLLISRYLEQNENHEELVGSIKTAEYFLKLMTPEGIANARLRDVDFFIEVLHFLRGLKGNNTDYIHLANAYYICGAILLKGGNRKYGLYFDISLGITGKKCKELVPEHTIRICETLAYYGDYKQALSILKSYLRDVRLSKRSKDEKKALIKQGYAMKQNLRRAGSVLGQKEATTFREENVVVFKSIKAHMDQGDRLVKKNPREAIKCYETAHKLVEQELIEREEISLLKLYQQITERLAYTYVCEKELVQEAEGAFFTSQRLCKKLYYLTEDCRWNDKRVELIDDAMGFFGESKTLGEQKDAIMTTRDIIHNKMDTYSSAIHRIAHGLVKAFLVIMLAIGFVVAPAMLVALYPNNWQALLSTNRLLSYFEEFMQFFIPPFMALAVLQLQLNLSELHKTTVRYYYGRKKWVQYGFIYLGLLVFVVLYSLVRCGLLMLDMSRDRLWILFETGYYYLLNASLVVCLVWILVEMLRLFLQVRQILREGFYLKKQLQARFYFGRCCKKAGIRLLLTLLPTALVFIGRCSGREFESLTYWGTRLEDIWHYHWVPFVAELIFSCLMLAGLFIYSKPAGIRKKTVQKGRFLKAEMGKLHQKTMLGLVLGALCIVAVFVGGRYLSQLRDYSTFQLENGYYYKVFGDTAVIYGYDGTQKDLVIPDTLGGKPVTRIGANAFSSYGENLESIVLSDNIRVIQKSAFHGCTNLESVTFSENLVNIGQQAFMGCTSLKAVHLPESLKELGVRSFSKCSGMEEVTFGNQLSYISDECFEYCSSIKELDFPESITYIDGSAFFACTSLVDIQFPENLEGIGAYAFSNCSSLTEITIPSGMRSHNIYAFTKCDALTTVTLNCTEWKGKSQIYSLFYQCPNLTTVYANVAIPLEYFFQECPIEEIVIGEEITALPENFARNIDTLKAIRFHESVTSIGKKAFWGCSGLEEISLPKSLERIEDGAFAACLALKKVQVSSLEEWCEIELETKDASPMAMAGNLYIDGSLVTELRIPVSSVGAYTFYGFNCLNRVDIPSYVESLGVSAFGACPNIQIVNLEDVASWCGVQIAGPDASPLSDYWYDYTSYYRELYINSEPVQQLIIPDTVTEIAPYTFYYTMIWDKPVYIPSSVENIGEKAFQSFLQLHLEEADSWIIEGIPELVPVSEVYVNGILCK